jgi:hypothetical protein
MATTPQAFNLLKKQGLVSLWPLWEGQPGVQRCDASRRGSHTSDVTTMSYPSQGLENGASLTGWWQGGTWKWQWRPGHSHGALSQVSVTLELLSHFLLISWNPLGEIWVLPLFISAKGISWFPLGLGWRGRERRMPLGFLSLPQGSGSWCVQTSGVLLGCSLASLRN